MDEVTRLLEEYGLSLLIEESEEFECVFEESIKKNAEKQSYFSLIIFNKMMMELFSSSYFIEISDTQKFSHKINLFSDGSVYPEWFLKSKFMSICAEEEYRLLIMHSFKAEECIDDFEKNAVEKDHIFGDFVNEYKISKVFDSVAAKGELSKKIKEETNNLIYLFAHSSNQMDLRDQLFKLMEDRYRKRLNELKA